MATASPLAVAENLLGPPSFILTGVADVFSENTAVSPDKGIQIGGDTLVSARNMILGFVPELNVDYVVNLSQLTYDEKRRTGEIPGQSLPLADWKSIFRQFFWENTPWQSAWSFVSHAY